ncbi:hypothetical protein ACIQAC_15185 [Streptomyces sp. NPDC088387]|uniref:hypothetical protein n=1 Tax=Streptomyces sp. NPDC088387 TaxID=3365859 RepID=UPI0038244F3B
MDRIEVYISDEGLAEIDGEPLVPAPDQSVHDAVLDRLQWYAQERAASVEATVNQGSGPDRFALRVAPDGSSRLLVSDDEDTPSGHPALDDEDAPSAGPAPDDEDTRSAGPAPDAWVLAEAVARAMATARATSPGAPATVEVPVAFAERIAAVNALVAAGRPAEALADATELRENLTRTAGAEDPHALEARSLEAYVAHLCGEHREAVVLALGVARIRCAAGDPRAPVDVARAASSWQRLDDDRAAVVHGRELLHVWDVLNRRGLLTPGHRAVAERVRRHVESLEAYA